MARLYLSKIRNFSRFPQIQQQRIVPKYPCLGFALSLKLMFFFYFKWCWHYVTHKCFSWCFEFIRGLNQVHSIRKNNYPRINSSLINHIKFEVFCINNS
jgi:hypothetical protein